MTPVYAIQHIVDNGPWSYSVSPEVRSWLLQHVGKEMEFSSKWGWKGKWRVGGAEKGLSFLFQDSKKALLFKLTWGGL